MALPIATWNIVTITATYYRTDGALATEGSVYFEPMKAVALDQEIVLPEPVTAQLNAQGQITAQLPCPDAPLQGATTLIYRVIERTQFGRAPYYIQLDHTMTSALLGEISPVAALPEYYSLKGPPGDVTQALLDVAASAVQASTSASQSAAAAAASSANLAAAAATATAASTAAQAAATTAAAQAASVAASATAAQNAATTAAADAAAVASGVATAVNAATTAAAAATAASDAAELAAAAALEATTISVQQHVTVQPLVPVSTNDKIVVTAQAQNITISNPTGATEDGQGFALYLRDDGTPRFITWGSAYRGVGDDLPANTTANKWLVMPVAWNPTDGKWDVFIASEET